MYWKPLYNLLEALALRPVVANAQHIKAVPGRKTDVCDAAWIADLHRHGLVPTSFIPDRPQRELRDLVRYRRAVVQERTREASRIQKVLKGANIKLASVASDVLGMSGRRMLQEIVAGCDDRRRWRRWPKGRLKSKRAALERALHGRLGPRQRLMLGEQLQHIAELEGRIARLSAEIEQRMAPFAAALEALDTIPGVGRRTAEDVVAEIGTDMDRFPSARHLASWAKICPGNHESAGKRKSGRTGHGNKWLRATLTEAAKAASRTRQTYLSAQYQHLAPRTGRNKATLAVAHSILTIVYVLLRDGGTYRDLRADAPRRTRARRHPTQPRETAAAVGFRRDAHRPEGRVGSFFGQAAETAHSRDRHSDPDVLRWFHPVAKAAQACVDPMSRPSTCSAICRRRPCVPRSGIVCSSSCPTSAVNSIGGWLHERGAVTMGTKLQNVLCIQDPTGLRYFLGTLHASEIKELTMVPVVTLTPPDAEHPDLWLNENSEAGYQRAGESRRMALIADFIRARPNCVIPPVLLSCRGRWMFEPASKTSTIGTLVAHDLAAIVDGQHRLGGLWRLATNTHAPPQLRNRVVPFMAIADMSLEDEKREFVDVNSNQRGVKKSLLRYLDRHVSFSGRAATALMEDEESVFQGRIDEQKKRDWSLILFGATQDCVDEMFGRALNIKKFDPARNPHQQEPALEFTLTYWRTVKEALPMFWADIDKLPAVRVRKSKDNPGTRAFRYRLLEGNWSSCFLPPGL